MPIQPWGSSGKMGGPLGQGKDSERGVLEVGGGDDVIDLPLRPGSSGEYTGLCSELEWPSRQS